MARQKFAQGVITDPKLAQKFLEWKDKYRPDEDSDLDLIDTKQNTEDYYVEEYDTTVKIMPGNKLLMFEEVDGKLVEITDHREKT